MARKVQHTGYVSKHTSVKVVQSASARSGQGGNPIAINASDVGVVRTNVNSKNRR